MLVLRSSEYNSTNNMAASFDEKIAEAVRRFPVLYDKSCKYFKDNNTKKNAWEYVAKIAGLSSGMFKLQKRKAVIQTFPTYWNRLNCYTTLLNTGASVLVFQLH